MTLRPKDADDIDRGIILVAVVALVLYVVLALL